MQEIAIIVNYYLYTTSHDIMFLIIYTSARANTKYNDISGSSAIR